MTSVLVYFYSFFKSLSLFCCVFAHFAKIAINTNELSDPLKFSTPYKEVLKQILVLSLVQIW